MEIDSFHLGFCWFKYRGVTVGIFFKTRQLLPKTPVLGQNSLRIRGLLKSKKPKAQELCLTSITSNGIEIRVINNFIFMSDPQLIELSFRDKNIMILRNEMFHFLQYLMCVGLHQYLLFGVMFVHNKANNCGELGLQVGLDSC